MLRRSRQLAALLFGLCISIVPVMADARPVVTLKLDAALVVPVPHGEKLVPLTGGIVHSGDLVRYTIVAKNSGDRPALKLMPAALVPAGTVLVNADLGTASAVEASRDHGRSWLPFATVAKAKITNLRWKFFTALAPGKVAVLHYDVRAL